MAMLRAAKGTAANVASSATSVTILAAQTTSARVGASVQNDSTAILYLLLDNAAAASTTNYTVKMQPDAYYETPFGYQGAITGIWASANGNARVMEFT